MKDLKNVKMESAFAECDAHCATLNKVCTHLTAVFPIEPLSFAQLDDGCITYIDQFLYRFIKLQDSMGMKLFPVMAALVSGSDEPRPFFDILNILEKNGVISSAEKWQELRVFRNTIAHEYPDSIEQTVKALNSLFVEWRDLEKMFYDVKDFYRKRVLGFQA